MPSLASGGMLKRADIESAMSQISTFLYASQRHLPIGIGDPTCLAEDETKSNILSDLKYLSIRNARTLKDMLVGGAEGSLVDDRTYIMERVISLAAELPLDSPTGLGLTNGFLTKLWNDLGHPPLSNLGSDSKYRTADGSNNNPMYPSLGAAGSPYARTIPPRTMQPIDLPNPGVVFESVMARRDFKPHPNKISSVLFYLASIIIHDLFRTNRKDSNNTDSSSYLDLAPLYGSNQRDQELIRTFKDGKIKPDTFSEKRLGGFPPGVGVLLIMFNRFHNHAVEELALINESGRFTKPKDHLDMDRWAKYDNELFQTGRLITCGLYINIILKDYVRTILSLNRTKSVWALDPRSENGKNLFSQGSAEAVGNQVSAEFNLVYRWHSCISQRDEEWSKTLFHQLFPGKDPGEVNTDDFVRVMSEWEKRTPLDPLKRPFATLQRSSEGEFKDDELAAIFTESVEDCAGAFGANQVPIVLRAVEILGIKQTRSWNLASLNEFRKHFKLAPHKKFEDINSNPLVAEQLRRLYDHPDFVELYPGVVVEDAKESVKPGSGLCTNFTISRAILSDAVTLVRGDRFYTVDYTPKHLTNWGFSEVNYDLDVDYGCVFYKLILRALPRNYRQDSIYAHYPLVIPSENHKILTELGVADDYSFDKPAFSPSLTSISSYAACRSVLENNVDFKTVWGQAIEFLIRDCGTEEPYSTALMLSGGGSRNVDSRCLMMEPAEQEVKRFYERTTLKLLHQNAYMVGGQNQIDVVQDLSNPAQVRYASKVFSLPLRTEESPGGLFTETELYLLMATVLVNYFYDCDPAKSFPLRQAARNVAQELEKLVKAQIRFAKKPGFLQDLLGLFCRDETPPDHGVQMIRGLLASQIPPRNLVWPQVLSMVGLMVVNQSQLFSQCLDYFLSDAGTAHLPEINRLSKENTAEADDTLLHYFMEGSRMRSVVRLPCDVVRSMDIQDGETKVRVEAGQRILCNLVEASMDPAIFPNPHTVVLDRDLDLYIHYGIGSGQCLGSGLSKVAMTAMLRTIGQLENLRRAPGPQGEIKKVVGPHGFTRYMTADQSNFFPFPTSMKVQWDGRLPAMTR